MHRKRVGGRNWNRMRVDKKLLKERRGQKYAQKQSRDTAGFLLCSDMFRTIVLKPAFSISHALIM